MRFMVQIKKNQYDLELSDKAEEGRSLNVCKSKKHENKNWTDMKSLRHLSITDKLKRVLHTLH